MADNNTKVDTGVNDKPRPHLDQDQDDTAENDELDEYTTGEAQTHPVGEEGGNATTLEPVLSKNTEVLAICKADAESCVDVDADAVDTESDPATLSVPTLTIDVADSADATIADASHMNERQFDVDTDVAVPEPGNFEPDLTTFNSAVDYSVVSSSVASVDEPEPGTTKAVEFPEPPTSDPPTYEAAVSASTAASSAASSNDKAKSSHKVPGETISSVPTPTPAPSARATAASSAPPAVSRPITPAEPEAQALTHGVMSEIISMPGNNSCIDCGESRPMWASLSFGGMMCLTCCGAHRAMGVHLSFMRSLNLDNWTEKQVMYMRVGGNDMLRTFFAEKGVQDSGQERYHTPAAALYRMRIKALADNTTVMPGEEASMLAAHLADSVAAEGNRSNNAHEMLTAPKWVPDAHALDCNVCSVRFSLLRRRHHCRFCGNVCCGLCAPSLNTKPIPKFGMTTPVRHCKQCYRSPLVNWAELEALAAKTDIFPFKFPLSLPKSN